MLVCFFYTAQVQSQGKSQEEEFQVFEKSVMNTFSNFSSKNFLNELYLLTFLLGYFYELRSFHLNKYFPNKRPRKVYA